MSYETRELSDLRFPFKQKCACGQTVRSDCALSPGFTCSDCFEYENRL
jgi:hypothetical protein